MNLEQIDTSTTAGKARVMQLAAEGRRVAYATEHSKMWMPLEGENVWNWYACKYAIISEPVGPEELWGNVIDGGHVMYTYSKEEDADSHLHRGWRKVKYIRADLAGEKG